MRRSRPVVLLLAWALAGMAGGASARPIGPELFGRTVAAIAFTSETEADPKEIGRLIAIRVGDALTEDATGATIRNLFGTRGYSDVVVEAEPAGDGAVAVIVHLWRAYRVGHVGFSGKFPLSREELRRALAFAEGDPFDAAALAEGASALQRRLAAEGYLHPEIEPDVRFDAARFTAAVTYVIHAGEQARFAEPFLDGETGPFAPALLLQKAGIAPGRRYSESRARAGADRIRKFLLGQGHFRGVAELIAVSPTEDGRIQPVYRIAVGPRFEIRAAGVSVRHARRELLGLLEGQGFDADLLQQWVDTTRHDLQAQGYYRAKVDAAMGSSGDPVLVNVVVEKGKKFAVEKIVFSGNASVPEKTLRGLLVTRPKKFLVRKGRLLDSDLDEDVSAVLGYYQTQGWIDARVEKPAVDEGSKPGLLDLTIRIVEGPRAFVTSRTVEGAEHLAGADVERILSVKIGQPFNPTAVRQDVSSLTTYYWNNGWREAAIQDQYTVADDHHGVTVVYRVQEGTRSFFGKAIVRGNAVTNMSRILRQVAWREGQPYSEEKIAETQQNLARTGVFRSIELRPQATDPENQVRNIDIDVSEARRFSLLYGFGYQNAPGATQNRNDVFGIIGGTYRNLFGSMRSASLELQYAPISKRGHVFASFLEPYLFNADIPLNFVTFVSREPIQDIDIDRLGTFLESSRVVYRFLRVGLRYEYEQIKPHNPEDLSTIELEKFPKSDLPIKQSAIGPNLLWDRRDDIIDPHAGYYASLAGKYAFKFLSADARYGKVSGQVAWFRSVLGGVLGASGKVGAIFPTDVAVGVPVPIAERFFSGGSATGRGFDTDVGGIPGVTVDYNTQATRAATPGTGDCAAKYPALTDFNCSPGPRIIGGNGFMAWSLEYRVPILGNLGASIFYDLSQVWEKPADINFHIEGQSGMRQSIGAGLHYITPIGPLRLEYGIPVNRRTIFYDVTSNEPDCPAPFVQEGTTCKLPSVRPSIKETGRVLLSIGYPF